MSQVQSSSTPGANAEFSDMAYATVQLQKSNAKVLDTILPELPILLPDDGEYYLELVGRTLTVSEAKVGISKYKIRSGADFDSVESGDGGVIIKCSRPAYASIVLLSDPRTIPPNAVSAHEVSAPLSLLKEFSRLENKGVLTRDELRRKRELIGQVGKAFVDRHAEIERREAAVRSTPAAVGESRSSGTRFCG